MTKKSNLMLVVRTSFGANKVDPKLTPVGVQTFEDSEGKEHSFELAHFDYLGDTHIRFVFDSETTMANATPEEFEKFKLTPEEAVEVAIANIYREYGQPDVYKLESGAFQVQGKSPDFDSSYFLDGKFWKQISNHFGDDIVVAVPARALLLFSPAQTESAVSFLSTNVQTWFEEAEQLGVSSALYLYKDGAWSVHQSPSSQQ